MTPLRGTIIHSNGIFFLAVSVEMLTRDINRIFKISNRTLYIQKEKCRNNFVYIFYLNRISNIREYISVLAAITNIYFQYYNLLIKNIIYNLCGYVLGISCIVYIYYYIVYT